MGLETDITDIQSLNQNWPPVSDPRAQGADHIRNIKKAIQLTFPNLKQCLLNDAQFTALGTLIGDGSGTFTINGKLTVSDTLTVKGTSLVPTVTDWTTQQAVGAKDAEGRYLKPGDADGRYLKPGDADGRYVQQGNGGNTSNSGLTYAWIDLVTESAYPRLGVTGANGTTYGFYGIAKVNALIGSCLANNNPGISGALAGTSLCVNPADGLPYLAYNGNSKIVALARDSDKLNVSGGTVAGLRITGALQVLGNLSAVWNGAANAWSNTYVDNSGAATWDLNGGSPSNNTGNKSWLRMYADGTLRTGKDAVAFQSDLPLDANQRIQSFSFSIADGGRITFPVSFSGVPTSIQLQCMQTASRITVANPTSDPQAWGIPSVGIQIVAGDHTQLVTTPITVWVTAIGPK